MNICAVFLHVIKIRRFGHKREELTGDWRKLHSEEPCDLYCLSNVLVIIKEDEMGSACGMYGGEEKCIQGKCEDKRPLGRPRW
jgi:hypothetical protein